MPLLHPSDEGHEASMQDPWDWSVDQVINALCNPQSQLRAVNTLLKLPDTNLLANKLREHDVNGLALLEEVNTESLKNDFAIKSFSHRGSINYMIRLLQDESRKYQEHHERKSSSRGLRSSTGFDAHLGSPYTTSHNGSAMFSGMSGKLQSPQSANEQWPGHLLSQGNGPKMPNATFNEPLNILDEAPLLPRLGTSSLVPPPTAGSVHPNGLGRNVQEQSDIDGAGQSRIGVAENKDAVSEQYQQHTFVSGGFQLTNEPVRVRESETTIIDDHGRKRRRLALVPTAESDLLANKIDHKALAGDGPAMLQMETPYVSTLPNNSPALSSRHSSQTLTNAMEQAEDAAKEDAESSAQPVPGLLHIDPTGRKRMMPILQSDAEVDLEEEALPEMAMSIIASTEAQEPVRPRAKLLDENKERHVSLGKRAKRDAHQTYLGLEPLPVDRLFYGDTDLGQTLENGADDEDDNFSFVFAGQHSDGQRRYVNARIKYFFQSPRVHIQRQEQEYLGIVPYPSHIGEKHRPLSITLFSKSLTPNGTFATRANRLKWIDDDLRPVPASGDEEPQNAFNIADIAMAVDEDQDADWASLEKWKYMDGDVLMPVYGDSGSEGEYDLDTWKEMEEENGKMMRPEGKSRSRLLATEEVLAAIDTAMKEIAREWAIKKQPKLLLKAWKLWAKAGRDGDKHTKCTIFEKHIHDLDLRLDIIRKEITKEEWSSPKQVIRQSKIMQQSVFDREEYKWKLAIVRQKVAPEKLQPPPKKPKIVEVNKKAEQPLEDGEELLATDAEDSELSDDDFDGFVVEDDVDDSEQGKLPPMLDEDFTMADADDELLDENKSDILLVRSGNKSEEPPPIVVPKALPTPPKSKPPPLSKFIDLTQTSSDNLEQAFPLPKKEISYGVRTPPVYDSGDDSERWFQLSRSQKATFKKPPKYTAGTVIDLESSGADVSDLRAKDSPSMNRRLPLHSDIKAIKNMDATSLVRHQDRKRLLIHVISRTSTENRLKAAYVLDELSMEMTRKHVWTGMKSLLEHKREIRKLDKETSDGIMQIVTWFICWTVPIKYNINGLSKQHIETSLGEEEGYEPFYDFLLECMRYYDELQDSSSPLPSPTPKKKKRERIVRGDREGNPQASSARQRVFAISESQETLEKRQAARERMQAVRKRELEAGREKMESSELNASEVFVNPGKLECQEYIRLNPNFDRGVPMKPHQKAGLQFLWREITAEQVDMQGCLLAQTMGLGKTMQVIALLVTLAEAAKSDKENIRIQVPPSLRRQQTLILCPPALVENWWDEILIWAPEPRSDNIGELRKVTASQDLGTRLNEIQAWSKEGGVLLMGFTSFRDLARNKRKKRNGIEGPGALDDGQHQMVRKALLERPNIVVADEAHGFKTQKSGLNKVINQVKTRSRIALTGSPLSNNLIEYFALVDWISPGFLGDESVFRATYEEPIREGLYQDSEPSQYREARKRLKALELEMDPKVNRADISALDGHLNGKDVYVIKLPLTALQEKLYRVFVGITLADEPQSSLLWKWLHILQLLCNHPKLFANKLNSIEAEMKKSGGAKASGKTLPAKTKSPTDLFEDGLPTSEEEDILNEPESESALSRIIPETQAMIADLRETIDILPQSNKMHILMSIVKLSAKVGDKVLIFSHQIPTLDYVASELKKARKSFVRIDGSIAPTKRPAMTKSFNESSVDVCLVSTQAGGQGLNLFGANRVVILDEGFNPMWEQQAMGRAYRIGQLKHVYVYRLAIAGTFEQVMQNQGIFKEQLATRVVDKKNPVRSAVKGAGEYLFLPKDIEQDDLDGFRGEDPLVLDHLLAARDETPILSIIKSSTFHVDDELTAEERKEAEQMQRDEQLRRKDPAKYFAMVVERRQEQVLGAQPVYNSGAVSTKPSFRQPAGATTDHSPRSYGLEPPIPCVSNGREKEPPQMSVQEPAVAGNKHGLEPPTGHHKRPKITHPSEPGFKGTGATEKSFSKLLEDEAARSQSSESKK